MVLNRVSGLCAPGVSMGGRVSNIAFSVRPVLAFWAGFLNFLAVYAIKIIVPTEKTLSGPVLFGFSENMVINLSH
jgi:low affinity Fe/Cu permease